MKVKLFFRGVKFIFPIALVILLICSPTSAETNYSIEEVTPSYIEGDEPGLSFAGEDEDVLEVDLPFPFTFYGVAYDKAYVSTNGFLSFTGISDPYPVSSCLPTADSPNAAIYAFWTDLYLMDARLRTKLIGTEPNRQFVIEWRNVTSYWYYDLVLFDFEIVLYENGTILLQYRNIDGDSYNFFETGKYAVIGLENGADGVAAEFACGKEDAIDPGTFAIMFVPDQSSLTVPVDIKPLSCPNPINVVSRGVLPVAILGTANFNVKTIDPRTVTLEGVAPISVRWPRLRVVDLATPYEPYVGKVGAHECTRRGRDRHPDMIFHFDIQKIVAALGEVDDKAVITLHLSGKLLDGTDFSGEDVVTIINKRKVNIKAKSPAKK